MKYLHKDFQPGNFIFRDHRLSGIIGYEHLGFGYPIDDFKQIPWSTLAKSETFARSQIEGYLESEPIESFWIRYNLAVAMSITETLVKAYQSKSSQALQNMQYRTLEIVNTHDFIDGGPPVWF